jgi:hypothetical protein
MANQSGMIMKAILNSANATVRPLAVTSLLIMTPMQPISNAHVTPMNIAAQEILGQITKNVHASPDQVNAVQVSLTQLIQLVHANLQNSAALDKHGELMSNAFAIEPNNAAEVILLLLIKTATVQLVNAASQVGILGETMNTARATQKLIAVFTIHLPIPLKQIHKNVAIQQKPAA